eukprot:4738434-Amphidinium_carterae.1
MSASSCRHALSTVLLRLERAPRQHAPLARPVVCSVCICLRWPGVALVVSSEAGTGSRPGQAWPPGHFLSKHLD